jgi:hypothetical protein
MTGMVLMFVLGLFGLVVLVGAIALGVRIGTRPLNKEK